MHTDLLERLVTLVDAAVAPRGWHGPHLLVEVEDAGSDAAGLDVGLRELPCDGHPLATLLGFVAPESWLAIGTVMYGWASPMDGVAPSEHRDRRRVRCTSVVDRAGREAVTTSIDDGRVIDHPGEGRMSDALKRCVGAATPPPPPVSVLANVLWLETVLHDAAELRRPYTWKRAAAMRGDDDLESWTQLRTAASHPGAWGAVAAWMDDGMFARWVLDNRRPIDWLLREIDRRLPRPVAARIRREVRAV